MFVELLCLRLIIINTIIIESVSESYKKSNVPQLLVYFGKKLIVKKFSF